MTEQNFGIWYWIEKGSEKAFLSMCKEEGYKWMNGEEVDPNKKLVFNRVAIKDKVLSYIPASAWLAPQFVNVHRVRFQNEEEREI